MTFALYHVQYHDNFYYDYAINDLAGAHDHQLLSELVTIICDSPSLTLAGCINLIDFYSDGDYLDRTLNPSPIFTSYYRDAGELRANLRTDLQRLFPEEFV